MNEYCQGALVYLKHAFDPGRALFSYSTSLAGDEIVNDFEHPQAVRYTVNTLLGLSEAERHGGPIDWLGDVRSRVDEFVERHGACLEVSDHSLLLVLLSRLDLEHAGVTPALAAVRSALDDRPLLRLNMQDLAWMLWGTTRMADDERAEVLAHRIFGLIRRGFLDARTGLPRHSTALYRRNIVSFGSLVYFLRAMQEYADRFGSGEAQALFEGGAEQALRLQGPQGEWPWMLDVRTGRPFDPYPVFTVHQDSMAMLWLLPAAGLGMNGAAEAIERSFAWNFGSNELGVSLVVSEPCFWVYRSIERAEGHPRLRRYVRSVRRSRDSYPKPAARVRINRECRSYHLGWVLAVWSGRYDMPMHPAAPTALSAV